MDLKKSVAEFKALQKTMMAYNHASGLLYYDSVTGAPGGITDALGDTLGTLEAELHRLYVNDRTAALLDELWESRDALDAQTRRETEESKKDYDKIRKIPVEEMVAYSVLQNKSQAVWHEAKKTNDFALFLPYLEKMLETMKRFAGYYDGAKAPYDVWLNEFEEGFSTEYLDGFFAAVRGGLAPLLRRVLDKGDVIDDRFLFQRFPVEQQRRLSDYLMDLMTIDRAHCGLAETEHPFTINFSKYDVRITTHYYEDAVASSMYSVIHESGHALYELHVADELYGSCLSGGVSMGVHESQSRFWENIIGRSPEFVGCIFPKLQELFPQELKGVTAERFYRAVNKAAPSLIRTEADELTYPLHIMVRYEIEKKLFSGEVKPAELPEVWNAMYREYLGVTVPDDTHGVLQDSHWSGGQIGYFPSYAVGSAYSAQILRAMQKDLDVFGLAGRGELAPIVGWLTERIYRFGCMKKPVDLIRDCCGAAFDPRFYVDYLTEKYTKIYDL